MNRIGSLLFAVLGVFSMAATVAQAAPPPQAPDAAQTSVAQLAPAANAQVSVPHLVQFSGTLKDSVARPVPGLASVTFAIYAEQDGGTALWSETQNVTADANGHYSAVLGVASATGVPQELFGTGQSRWLGVQIARQPEQPRVLLVSVPYALKAADAEMLGGQPASAFVTTQALAANNARTTPANTPAPASTTAIITSSPQATPTSPTGSGTTDFLPLWTSTSTLGNSALFQKSGMIGLNTTTPAELLDVNGNSIWRGSFQLAPDHPATASSGFASHSFQFQASSFNSTSKTSQTNSFGFQAVPLGNNSTSTSAKLDLFYGPNGGALADTGLSFSTKGIITFASGQTFPGNSAVTELNLPNTTSSTVGLINFGGAPFINNFGISNTFVGSNAGGNFAGTSGGGNAGLGSSALSALTTGNDNTATGADAMTNTTTGAGNTASGTGALLDNSTGSFNTAFGVSALSFNSSGNNNTAVGEEAGLGITTGGNITLLGSAANVASGGLSNATALGANSVVGANNALVLGGTGTNAVNVGIGTSTPRSLLELSSPNLGTVAAPLPTLTLTNTAGSSSVALDFNTDAPSKTGTYNPSARIEAVDDGFLSDSLIFYINKLGSPNNGLIQTLKIDDVGGVFTTGNLEVGGTLFKSSGAFKIDDPIAPAEKYLSHSFVESPDMMNIYNGTVVLDAHGKAIVELPAWFSALNRDFQYQLTAIGRPGPKLYVAEKVHDNQFKIAGGKPHMEVSWMLTGIRHDAWANAHRIPTEELKPANEQGRYLHPELFGAGPDQSINVVNRPHSNPAPAAGSESSAQSAGGSQ